MFPSRHCGCVGSELIEQVVSSRTRLCQRSTCLLSVVVSRYRLSCVIEDRGVGSDEVVVSRNRLCRGDAHVRRALLIVVSLMTGCLVAGMWLSSVWPSRPRQVLNPLLQAAHHDQAFATYAN
jgi:hypothetical protein